MQASIPRPPRATVEEYLQFERAAIERHIYLDGKIEAMVGESDAHSLISGNLMGEFYMQLKGKPCVARTKDTKVRSGPALPRPPRETKGMFSYPDIVVVCGPAEHYDDRKDIVLNPRLIVEVLSPSTQSFDRGQKFDRFRHWNNTLTDYLLVRQEWPSIDHYTRQPDGSWNVRFYTELEAIVPIEAIDCTLKLADVYDRVEFPPEEESE